MGIAVLFFFLSDRMVRIHVSVVFMELVWICGVETNVTTPSQDGLCVWKLQLVGGLTSGGRFKKIKKFIFLKK